MNTRKLDGSAVAYTNNYLFLFFSISNTERDKSIKFYNENMNKLTKGNKPLLDINFIKYWHDIYSNQAIVLVKFSLFDNYVCYIHYFLYSSIKILSSMNCQ